MLIVVAWLSCSLDSRSYLVSLHQFYLALTSPMILLTALHPDSQPNFLRDAKYKVHLSFQVSLLDFETHRLSAISILGQAV